MNLENFFAWLKTNNYFYTVKGKNITVLIGTEPLCMFVVSADSYSYILLDQFKYTLVENLIIKLESDLNLDIPRGKDNLFKKHVSVPSDIKKLALLIKKEFNIKVTPIVTFRQVSIVLETGTFLNKSLLGRLDFLCVDEKLYCIVFGKSDKDLFENIFIYLKSVQNTYEVRWHKEDKIHFLDEMKGKSFESDSNVDQLISEFGLDNLQQITKDSLGGGFVANQGRVFLKTSNSSESKKTDFLGSAGFGSSTYSLLDSDLDSKSFVSVKWGDAVSNDYFIQKGVPNMSIIKHLLSALVWVQDIGYNTILFEKTFSVFSDENWDEELQKMRANVEYLKQHSYELVELKRLVNTIHNKAEIFTGHPVFNHSEKELSRHYKSFVSYPFIKDYLDHLDKTLSNKFLSVCSTFFLGPAYDSIKRDPVLSPWDGQPKNWITFKGSDIHYTKHFLDKKHIFFPIDAEHFYVGSRAEGLVSALGKFNLSKREFLDLLKDYLIKHKIIRFLEEKLKNSKSSLETLELLFILTNGNFGFHSLGRKNPDSAHSNLLSYFDSHYSMISSKVSNAQVQSIYFNVRRMQILKYLDNIDFYVKKRDYQTALERFVLMKSVISNDFLREYTQPEIQDWLKFFENWLKVR